MGIWFVEEIVSVWVLKLQGAVLPHGLFYFPSL